MDGQASQSAPKTKESRMNDAPPKPEARSKPRYHVTPDKKAKPIASGSRSGGAWSGDISFRISERPYFAVTRVVVSAQNAGMVRNTMKSASRTARRQSRGSSCRAQASS